MKAVIATAAFFLVMFIVGLFGAGGEIFVLGVVIVLYYWTYKVVKFFANRYYEARRV